MHCISDKIWLKRVTNPKYEKPQMKKN
uniref:Uncharacterized protein n=1 Tax=Anguilla anguilla TaxID=7936 RepID=A0A0E9XMR8_ANGAN